MTIQKKHSKGVSNSIKVHKFIKDVYPNFYAKSWLGAGTHDKYVDNFIDDIIRKVTNETN